MLMWWPPDVSGLFLVSHSSCGRARVRNTLFCRVRIIVLRQALIALTPIQVYIFRQRIVIGSAITHFINGYLTMVQVFYIPSFYQLAYGYSPTKSAAFMLTLTVVQSEYSSVDNRVI